MSAGRLVVRATSSWAATSRRLRAALSIRGLGSRGSSGSSSRPPVRGRRPAQRHRPVAPPTCGRASGATTQSCAGGGSQPSRPCEHRRPRGPIAVRDVLLACLRGSETDTKVGQRQVELPPDDGQHRRGQLPVPPVSEEAAPKRARASPNATPPPAAYASDGWARSARLPEPTSLSDYQGSGGDSLMAE